MLGKKPRRWEAVVENDPLAGLINLFDLWMVFSVALLIALLGYLKLPPSHLGDADRSAAGSGVAAMEQVGRDAKPLERFRVSRDELSGEGRRLGTAYRLKTGEVVYVPDASEMHDQPPPRAVRPLNPVRGAAGIEVTLQPKEANGGEGRMEKGGKVKDRKKPLRASSR